MNHPTLYLMFGYPGAGKTTASKVIADIKGAIRLSSDEIRFELFPNPEFTQEEHDALYRELDERAEKLLYSGKSVIYDANLTKKQHRHDKYIMCRRNGAGALLIWVRTPRDTAKLRAVHESRSHLVPVHETPHDMFERIADIIEEPGHDEPHIVLDGTKITPEHVAKKIDVHHYGH